jgi:hypothetical protein
VTHNVLTLICGSSLVIIKSTAIVPTAVGAVRCNTVFVASKRRILEVGRLYMCSLWWCPDTNIVSFLCGNCIASYLRHVVNYGRNSQTDSGVCIYKECNISLKIA